jgi:hypothetical protein
VPPINVLVASTTPDTKAGVIAERVAARADMTLVGGRFVAVDRVDAFLVAEPPLTQMAIVVLGDPAETRVVAERWLATRADLVVMLVDFVDDVIRIEGITLRDPRLDALLTTLREIVERVGSESTERVVRIDLTPKAAEPVDSAPVALGADTHPDAAETDGPGSDVPAAGERRPTEVDGAGESRLSGATSRPLLEASIDWLHHLLRDAVDCVPSDNGDVHGLSVTRATLLQSLEAPLIRTADDRPAGIDAASRRLDAELTAALEQPDQHLEPLAVAAHAFNLNAVELRLLVLALAPEIDFRFQRCIGFLLDEMGRRVGTFALYATLLDATATLRDDLARAGALDRWLVFDGPLGQRAPADEPLRVDPFVARWLLGETDALGDDPRLRRILRIDPWPGATLLRRPRERRRAADLLLQFTRGNGHQWLVLNRADAAGWRALLELGASENNTTPIRVEAASLHGLDTLEIEETARRLVRYARCTGRPLAIDSVKAESLEGGDDWLAGFVVSLNHAGCRAVVICADEARIVAFIGQAPFQLIDEEALPPDALVEAVRRAAEGADVHLPSDDASAMASRFPLRVDALEEAMHLARSRSLDYTRDDPRRDRFTRACKELSARGVSHLADRLDPVFDLDDVVLPADRKGQLVEIVENVRLAHVVLDEWRFGERLPYGRGVTALFFGPSGTGKTMAAMAIARRLDVEILRLDLSRVVSKYIGDTEKNIDRVFTDARRTGAALLVDEADALFGKRSEVKDAHDRWANIEVAFILQRMDAFDGLAILTTNMRQSLDPAFLRRLRFIVEFPRPDVDAREQIWRQCLPDGTHALNGAAFRQLARKVDVTGGHIRQITLRAAFVAAAAGAQIVLEHVVQATRAELAKLGLPAVELDPARVRAA